MNCNRYRPLTSVAMLLMGIVERIKAESERFAMETPNPVSKKFMF